PNPEKRPTAKSVNHQVGLWIEEILSSDEDNEIKKQFLENDNTSQGLLKPVVLTDSAANNTIHI
ncbi:24020_t:CDS:2, partial [Racocetra persica]